MKFLRQLKQWMSLSGGLPIVWLLLTAFAMIPVWNQRLLPLLHYPNDLAIARILHNLSDEAFKLGETYALRSFPAPGVFPYYILHAMLYLLPMETAGKIYLCAYLALFPLSLLLLARALGRSPWLAVFGFALAFNRNWAYGYTGFLAASVLMLLGWTALLRFLDGGRSRAQAALFAASLACGLAHPIAFFVFIGGALPILARRYREPRRLVQALIALSPSLLLYAATLAAELGERIYFKTDEYSATYRDFPTLVLEFPKRLYDLFPGYLDTNLLATMAAGLLGLWLWRRRAPARDDETRRNRDLAWLLVASVVGYMMLPWDLSKPMAISGLAPRLTPIVAALLVLAPRGPVEGWKRLLIVPAVIAAVVMPLRLGKLYRDYSRRHVAMVRLVREVPRGSRTLLLHAGMRIRYETYESGNDPASSVPVHWYTSAWPLALSGGYAPYLQDEGTPVKPIHKLRTPKFPPPDDLDIRQAPEFDFYLVRHHHDGLEREPALKLVDQMGDWALFQRIYVISDEP